jgi:tripartite-type tricarboxylate transporter receptor subunit TctC
MSGDTLWPPLIPERRHPVDRRTLIGLALVSSLVLGSCSDVHQGARRSQDAGAYPKRDITMIVQAAAGGTSDLVARTMAKEMERVLQIHIVVVNRPGASGSTALTYVAGQPADGYTLGYVPVEIAMLKYRGYAVTPEMFTLLGQVLTVPAVVVVKSDSPYKTLKDLVTAAKSGTLTLATAGAGSIWDLSGQLLGRHAGASFKAVPFDGGAPSVAAVLAGQVNTAVVGASEAVAAVKDGRLRALAVFDAKRNDQIPEVPTGTEAGVDLTIGGWGGIAAPAGLPATVRSKLVDAVKQAAESESYRITLTKAGATPVYVGPDEFTAFARSEHRRFGTLLQTPTPTASSR